MKGKTHERNTSRRKPRNRFGLHQAVDRRARFGHISADHRRSRYHSPHIVKERCDQLVNVTHEVERISRGVYRAIKAFAPPRPISKTMLADGEVVLEIGDDVVHLTPQEDKMLRGLFGSAPVEIHQPAQPMQASTVNLLPQSPIMEIEDIAKLYGVSNKVARDRIVRSDGFPKPITGSTDRKRLWARVEIESNIQANQLP